jgi:hypothetical protein
LIGLTALFSWAFEAASVKCKEPEDGATAPRRSTKIETKLNDAIEDDQGCRSFRVDLGKQETSSTLEVLWAVENNTPRKMELPTSTSSCGCIRGLTQGLCVEKGDTVAIEFQLRVPAEEGKVGKQIALFDHSGVCRVRLELEFDPISPFVIREVNPIDREGKQTLRIPLELLSDEVQLADFGLSVEGSGVFGSKLLASSNGEKPCIELDLDTSEMGSDSLVSARFEFYNASSGVRHTSLVRSLWVLNRPYTNPKVVPLRRESPKWIGEFKLFCHDSDTLPNMLEATADGLIDPNGHEHDAPARIKVRRVQGQDFGWEGDGQIEIEDTRFEHKPGSILTASFTVANQKVRVKCVISR